MATLATALTTSKALAAPLEWGGVQVPTVGNSFEQGNDLLGSFRVLTGQTTSYQDALHRLSHVQPGATQRSVERHDAMFEEP
jgi:hypothetical protein